MAWKPGESGNPDGGKVERKWHATLDRAIVQDDSKRLRAAAEKLLDLAAQGEGWAIKELGDRLDGKAKQQVEATGANGGAIIIQVASDDSRVL